MNELSALSGFLVGLKMDSIPKEVKEDAALHVLDTIGTAIGAHTDLQIQSVTKAWVARDAGNSCHIWGTGIPASFSTSLFLNAMMGHTLEMDDVHTTSKTHIGTVVIPAAWSAAEYLDCTGEEFLLSVICGYEVMSRIGMAFGVSSHRTLGWHVTATAGTFGAAAAVGKLLKLDQQQMTYALGLAGAQSFGTWAFLEDGATCKALNPARASQSGAEAAFLAQAGMTGPEHILTASDGGILNCMTKQPEMEKITAGLGSVWQTLLVDKKPYPSCRSTHCAIDAALELRSYYKIPVEEIDHIDVETYLVGYQQCGVSEGSIHPVTTFHAKFSTPYTVACALIYGEMSRNQLRVEVVGSELVQKLVHKVRVIPTDEFTVAYPNQWGCRMIVYMDNGKVYQSYVENASGSVNKPLSRQQVTEKAVSLMQDALPDQADEITAKILNISQCCKIPILK